MRLRVLDDGPCEPAWTMALDEALLLDAAEPVLRLYGWRPHAVSLGWFQRRDEFADLPPDVPVVRRITGGGAIHHAEEVTFALALDAALLPGDVDASYALLHDAVAAALRRAGVATQRLQHGAAAHARPAQRWCFAVPGRHDLVTADGSKLVGSAQRRIRQPRERVLHHGSIVLRRPALTPFTASVADVVDPEGAVAVLRAELPRTFAAVLDLHPVAARATDGERALATTLLAERHTGAGDGARRVR